ncbi:MAG: hypothetical protein V3T41_09275 [bacterium]
MRRLVTVLTALLLATAAAAGAGDNIKWKRAKNLEYASPDEPLGGFTEDFDKIVERNTLKWLASHGSDFNYIRATYVDWRLFCTHLQAQAQAGIIGRGNIEDAAEKAREEYEGKFQFLVAVTNRRIEWARLTNKDFWEVYLEVDGEKIAPVKMEPLDDGRKTSARIFTDLSGHHPGAIYAYANRTYKLTFDAPQPELRPRNLKLVLLCEKARRGFEWRFKEE